MVRCTECNENAIKYSLCVKHLKEYVKMCGFKNSRQMEYVWWNYKDKNNML